jgi:hypothetical protein
MARKGKNTSHVNKVSDDQLIEAYRTMRSRNLNKKEAVEFLRQTFVDPSLKDEDRQAVADALYRKIFVRNEANPKAEGIIPRAIRRRELAAAKLQKFETLVQIKTFEKLRDELDNPALINKMETDAKRQNVTPQEMWRNTVLTMTTQIPKLQAAEQQATAVLAACEVSEDGVYWTPGRAKADGLDDILYAKGDDNVPGLGLDTLSQLFNELNDE